MDLASTRLKKKEEDRVERVVRHLDLVARRTPCSIEADFHFPGKKFVANTLIEHSNLEALKAIGVVETVNRVVFGYDRKCIQKLFRFEVNGFEYRSLQEGALLKALSEWKNKEAQINPILDLAKGMVEDWGRKKGWIFERVFPLSIVYREETATGDNEKIVPPANFVHVDFAQFKKGIYGGILRHLLPVWKPVVDQGLDMTLTEMEYIGLPIKKMVHVWFHLPDQPTEHTLGVMDASRIKFADLLPFRSVASQINFIAFTLKAANRQQFIFQRDMKLGDVLYLDTLFVPHSAFKAPRPEAKKGLHRNSIEMRFIFL